MRHDWTSNLRGKKDYKASKLNQSGSSLSMQGQGLLSVQDTGLRIISKFLRLSVKPI